MTTMRKRRPSYFHHMRQPNGFTCGSTCVRMAASILLDRQNAQLHLGPHEVAGMMGTNPRTGPTSSESACMPTEMSIRLCCLASQ